MKNKNEIDNLDEVLEYISINKEKYQERFSLLNGGKRKFNFSSAIFGGFWLAFHFMFLEWAVLLIIELLFDVGINLLSAWNFDKPSTVLVLDMITILFNLLVILFFGFFGDSLLLASIKKKLALQKKGIKKYNWINELYNHEKIMLFRIVSVVISCGLSLLVLTDLAQSIYFAIVY